MCNEGMDKEARKPESQRLEVDIEKDAMAPKITEVIDDQEDSNTTQESRTSSLHINEDCKLNVILEDQEDNSTTQKSRTGSLHINDCKLSEPIFKNVFEDNQESDGIVLDPEAETYKDIQGVILNEIKIDENIIINNERSTDHTDLQLTNSGCETGVVSTLTTREALICKKLTKSDLTRAANGLRLPVKKVRKKLLPHIGEEKDLILIDHKGQEWDILLVRTNEDLYFLKGHWYDYAELYNLAVSDTIVIERITKLHVKEELDFAAVSEIGDHDWDTIFPPNSTWQIEQLHDFNAEDDVEQPDELAEKFQIKDIGKVEPVVMYEITIKRGPENTSTAPE